MTEGKGVLAARNFALDGLRGLAVAAVVVYHVWPDWLPGGFLGVSVFFTLSGFLITTLLLDEWMRDGSVDARRFWSRRARRLLPAAVAALALAVVVTAVAGDPHQLRGIGGDVAGAASYIANWRFIAQGHAYGAAYLEPSTLQHTWSLAIEEQFYLLLGFVAFVVARRARTLTPWVVVVASIAVLSIGSGLWIASQQGASGHDRIYFGTDTRAFELATGMGLAVLFHARGAPMSRRIRSVLSVAGALALGALVVATFLVDTRSPFVRNGGLWLVALLSITVVAAIVRPGVFARVLSLPPLVGLGVISYGLYLYHWPLLTLLTPERTHLDGVALGVVQVAASLVLAVLSYRFLEEPIRRQRWNVSMARFVPATAVATAVVVIAAVATGGLAGRRAVAADVDIVLAGATDDAPAAPDAPDDPLAMTATTAAPVEPVRSVLVLGDSLVHEAYPTIAALFGEEGVDTVAIGGPAQSWLTHDWLGELEQALAAHDPDVVILGGCCGIGLNQGADADDPGPWVESPNMARWEELSIRATEMARAQGRLVLWIITPPTQTNGWYGRVEERIDVIRRLNLRLAACLPGVGIVDWRVVSNPDGSYAHELPDSSGNMVVVRAHDYLHFTPPGQRLLAEVTVADVARAWESFHRDGADAPIETARQLGDAATADCTGLSPTTAPG